jgi:hypothetical protein
MGKENKTANRLDIRGVRFRGWTGSSNQRWWRWSSGGVKDVGTSRSGRHDLRDFAEVGPAFISEWFGFRVFFDIVVPGRCCFGGDSSTSLIVPMPTRNGLDRKDNLEDLAELYAS